MEYLQLSITNKIGPNQLKNIVHVYLSSRIWYSIQQLVLLSTMDLNRETVFNLFDFIGRYIKRPCFMQSEVNYYLKSCDSVPLNGFTLSEHIFSHERTYYRAAGIWNAGIHVVGTIAFYISSHLHRQIKMVQRENKDQISFQIIPINQDLTGKGLNYFVFLNQDQIPKRSFEDNRALLKFFYDSAKWQSPRFRGQSNQSNNLLMRVFKQNQKGYPFMFTQFQFNIIDLETQNKKFELQHQFQIWEKQSKNLLSVKNKVFKQLSLHVYAEYLKFISERTRQQEQQQIKWASSKDFVCSSCLFPSSTCNHPEN